ncbi:unnamed protein product [Brassica napus]|uniref:(rape) hypothetical protein n=1 Tax=Brassica napus TaxID=3708 RepID=A0A816UZA6_BRANA|nr:unnamed protein product [Brassica napus]
MASTVLCEVSLVCHAMRCCCKKGYQRMVRPLVRYSFGIELGLVNKSSFKYIER